MKERIIQQCPSTPTPEVQELLNVSDSKPHNWPLLTQTRSFKSAGSNHTIDMEYGIWKKMRFFKIIFLSFFPFFSLYPFIQSYIIFPAYTYLFIYLLRQAGHLRRTARLSRVWGREGPLPFLLLPSTLILPHHTKVHFFARLRRPWLPSAGQGCCCCS